MSFNCVLYHRYGLIAVVGLLCVGVLAQMVGIPGAVLDLLTSSDMLVESDTTDVSLTSVFPEPRTSNLSRLHAIVSSPVRLPCFVTSVFHPPLA